MFAIWYRVSATGRWYLSACEPLHERQSADQVAAVIAEALQRGGHEAAQSLVCGDGQMPAGVLFALAEQLRDDTSTRALGVEAPPAHARPQKGRRLRRPLDNQRGRLPDLPLLRLVRRRRG
jgi:hypothetical protein